MLAWVMSEPPKHLTPRALAAYRLRDAIKGLVQSAEILRALGYRRINFQRVAQQIERIAQCVESGMMSTAYSLYRRLSAAPKIDSQKMIGGSVRNSAAKRRAARINGRKGGLVRSEKQIKASLANLRLANR